MKRRFRFGLLARIITALTAVGLIPLAVVPYLVALNREAVTDQVLRTHAIAARSTAARVEAFLGSLKAGGEALALNPEVYQNPRSPGARELMAGFLQAQPLVIGVAITNDKGAEVIRVQARGRGGIVSAVLAAPSDDNLVPRREVGTLWVRLQVPLGEERGRLRLVIDGSALEGALQSEELGREAVLVVANEDGIIIGSEPGVTMDAFPPSLIAAGRSGRVSGSSRYEGRNGEGALGAYSPVSGTGWFVLSRQPARVAEEVAVEMRRRSLFAVGAALALTAVLSGLAYRSVVRPVRQLVLAQRRLARGAVASGQGNEIDQLREGLAAIERQTMDRAAIGKIFLGRYLVMELVGAGGMGSVFRGFDPKLQRAVALKTVHVEKPATLGSQTDRSSLLNEAVVLARVSHPNIVTVFDVEDAGRVAFVAMEFVEGTSLEGHLIRSGRLPPDRVVPLAAAIARGLAAAHAHGVIHRDVKPGNVLLGHDGSVKVSDFGIASHLSTVDSDASIAFGTPGYMPPEALRGEGQTVVGDLYAVGVVLYECLTGELPISGESVEETLLLTGVANIIPPREKAPEVSVELNAIVMGLLEKDPGRRAPAVASALAHVLEKMAVDNGWQWLPPRAKTGAEGVDDLRDLPTHALHVRSPGPS